MTGVRAVLGVLGVLAVLEVRGAGQLREARPNAAGTAVISGVILSDEADPKPVRKARVTCGATDVPGHTTITDENGRFVFTALPAGRYLVAASKVAWVNASYGAKRPGRAGSAIPVADGQKLDIVLRMARGAVITGAVLNHLGEPVADTQVRALRWTIVNGERRLTPDGYTLTNDRGMYRIFGLVPGDYVVNATASYARGTELRLPSDADVRQLASSPRAAPPPRTKSLAPTYFPSGTSASDAGLISLRAGEERSGVDFALQMVPTTRVEGTVLGAPAGTEIHLIENTVTPASGSAIEPRQSRVPAAGTFSFADVPPGQFTLLARARQPITNPDGTQAPAQYMWASLPLAVDGEPIGGLSLSLEPALSIAGQVRFESALLRPVDPKSARVFVNPVETRSSVSFAPPWVNPDAGWRFTIPNVMPGPYRFNISLPGSSRPGGWYLKSVVANGQDALDLPLVVQPNQYVLDAVITFTDRLAEVSGALQTETLATGDYTVVIFPEDSRYWLPQSRRIQGVRPAADGAYTIRNLPGGSYLIAVTDDVENGEWFDPAFLRRILPAATRITVPEGGRVSQNLRVPGGQ